MGIDKALPPRCQYIRVICCEAGARSAHLRDWGPCHGCPARWSELSYIAVYAAAKHLQLDRVPDRGAFHDFLYARGWPGGGTCRLDGLDNAEKFLEEVVVNIDESEELLTAQQEFLSIARGTSASFHARRRCDYGLTGPNLRGQRNRFRPAAGRIRNLVYDQLEFEVPIGSVGDSLTRYMVRIEEMRQRRADIAPGVGQDSRRSRPMPRRTPINVADGKSGPCRQRKKVLDEHGGTDSPVHPWSRRAERAARRSLFRRGKSERELGFYHLQQRRRRAVSVEIRAPSFCKSEHPAALAAPGHMLSDTVPIFGSIDFVMGECDR